MTALPGQFIQNMKERLGAGYTAFEKSFDEAPIKGFHFNTFYVPADKCAALIASEEELLEKLLGIDWDNIPEDKKHH